MKLAAAPTRGALTLAVLSALLLIAARPAQGQAETVLYSFKLGNDGGAPQSSLIFDRTGNLYGTTQAGGSGYGTVFELSPNVSGGWKETVLYRFTGGADGANPYSSLIFDSVGNLYGTASGGGTTGYGVVFELSHVRSTWRETVLHSFAGTPDGATPTAGLTMDAAGNLYGTTPYGGTGDGTGTVFELTPSGGSWTEQVIYDLDINVDTCGYFPSTSGLTIDAAGNIFGAACSIVFELSPYGEGGWTPTVIHTFTGAPNDGAGANGTPVLDKAGHLYGTTYFGGRYDIGTVYKLSPGGNGEWTEKILHSFGANPGGDCGYPWGGVVLDAAGNVYGTTVFGGEFGPGAVFELAEGSKETLLWSFSYGVGGGPRGSLILDGAGDLYGTTNAGGDFGGGVVFEVIVPTVPTTTTLVSSPNPSSFGKAATFTATVRSTAGIPPNGEIVNFKQRSTVLGTGTLTSGTAAFSDPTLAVGTDPVEAVYVGDANFFTSTSNKVSQVVTKASTTTTLVSSPNPSVYGQVVSFSATVSPQFSGTPAGSVAFYNGTAKLGTKGVGPIVAFYATTKLPAGTASITAEYEGSSSFGSSTSAAVSQVVNRASTTTTLRSSRNPSNSGQSVTFRAGVTGQFGGQVTGSVTFMNGTTTLDTVNLNGAGVAEYEATTLPVGTDTITATYDGSTDFTTSSASLTQTVN
jgi:uncharacterized repeat protein (TIGR03803 family)